MKRIVGTIILVLGLTMGSAGCKKKETSVTQSGSAATDTSRSTGTDSTTPGMYAGTAPGTTSGTTTGSDPRPDIIARTGSGIPGNTGIGSSGGGALGNTVGRPAPGANDPTVARTPVTERIGNTGVGSAGGGALGNRVGNEATTGGATGNRAFDAALVGTWREIDEKENTEATYILKEDGAFHLDMTSKKAPDVGGCTTVAALDGTVTTAEQKANLEVSAATFEVRDCQNSKSNRAPTALTGPDLDRLTKSWPAAYVVVGEKVIVTWKDGKKSMLQRNSFGTTTRN